MFDRLLPETRLTPRERFVRDLGRLLNARTSASRDGLGRDDGPAGYGLPALAGDLAGDPERITVLCRVIERAIERFEPRLAAVHVRAQGVRGGRLHLSIEAIVAPPARPCLVAEAVLCPDGRIDLTIPSEEDSEHASTQ
jgi:type VI secretion system lysozyme-like protein